MNSDVRMPSLKDKILAEAEVLKEKPKGKRGSRRTSLGTSKKKKHEKR